MKLQLQVIGVHEAREALYRIRIHAPETKEDGTEMGTISREIWQDSIRGEGRKLFKGCSSDGVAKIGDRGYVCGLGEGH